MSTTVTYKGDTLTTVNNNTKTLKTAGKYMEDDIVLVDTAAEGSQENNPIRFFDYDGTIVASYTEVPESLPPNPTHEGLTAQGWNWTLEDIATQFESTGTCDIGQMYVTDDGKTRIYITVSDQIKSFWFGLAPNGTLSIDWGDGSENSNMTGTSLTTIKTVYHSYITAGSYIISIEVENGEFAFYNTTGEYTRLFSKYESTSGQFNHPYGGCVTAIELGNNIQINKIAFGRLFNMIYITIPNTVTYIDNAAFSNCYALKSITIPSSVTYIGSSAFSSCGTLKSVIISDSVTKINDYTFEDCYALKSITIPNNVTSIGRNAFIACHALKSITIPDGVTSIGQTAFQTCYALESVIIPDSVTSINNSAFESCYALKSITIPNNVTKINPSTFSTCYALESVIIPDSVTYIDTRAFATCYALKSITIPSSVTYIGSSAFSSCNILKSVIIPNSVTKINSSTFQYCNTLKSVIIPDSVTYIDNSAFNSCYALESITIPDGITSITYGSFQYCYALKSITIPNSVTKIEGYAFSSCTNMDEYHFLSTTPPTLASTNVFSYIPSGCKIYVPYSEDHSVLNVYKTATNWSTYAKYIVEEGE